MTPLKELGSIGYIADQEGYELAPAGFSYVKNIRFYRGWAERAGGYSQVFTNTAVVPYFIAPYSTATTNYIVHAGLAAVYVDDGTTRTNITGTAPTGAVTDKWTGGSSSGILVLNNGKDIPTYWAGTGTLASLPGWTSTWRAKAVRPFKSFGIAMNITKGAVNYPHMVKWSHEADPGAIWSSWDEADPAKDAGEQDIAETPDLMVDGLQMGDIFVLYKQRSMYAMQDIGGVQVFRFYRLPGDVGMLTQGCAVQVPQGHVVLTAGDLIVHNGQGPRSLIDGKARQWLTDNMDASNYTAAFVTTNQAKREVWACFPGPGQSVCTKALVWNWADETISQIDLPNVTYAAPGVSAASAATWASITGATWAGLAGTWADYSRFAANDVRLFMGSTSSKIFVADGSPSAMGASFEATLERTGLHFDDPQKVKFCRGVWPKIDAPTGTQVMIQVGGSFDPETAPTWSAPQTFTCGTSAEIDVLVNGRYLAYRLYSNDIKPWRIRSMDFDIALQGKY